MKLNDYLRNKLNSHFYELVKKDSCEICEICGSTENLHVHHVYPFKDMVEDTLNELNLEYKDTDEYSEIELRNIVEKLLGKHLYYSYQTLCFHCHIQDVHKKHREVEVSMYEDLLDKWLDRPLTTEDKKRLALELNWTDDRGRVMKWTGVKNALVESGYEVKNTQRRIEGKQTKVTIITKA